MNYNNYNNYQQQQQTPPPSMPTKLIIPPEGCKTIWAGDLHGCDENYVKSMFSHVGEVISVKLIKDKVTHQPTGYGFIEFATVQQAQMAISLNGSTVGYTGRFYRLNWAKTIPNQVPQQQQQQYHPQQQHHHHQPQHMGMQKHNFRQQNQYNMHQKPHHYQPPMHQQQQMYNPPQHHRKQHHQPVHFQPNVIDTDQMGDYSIFVGDLGPEVNDFMLKQAFTRYSSLATAKVIFDPISNVSKMYGFVSFGDVNDYHNALAHMGGTIVGTRPIKVNTAKKEKTQLEIQFSQKANKQNNPNLNSPNQTQRVFNNISLNLNKEAINDPNNTVLFIGSLSGETNEEDLFRLFNAYGEIRAVKLSHNRDFGFVDFYNREDAKKGFVLDGTLLDGKKIQVNWGNSSELKTTNPRFKNLREDRVSNMIPIPTIQRQPNFQEPYDVDLGNQYYLDNNYPMVNSIPQEYISQIVPSSNNYQGYYY